MFHVETGEDLHNFFLQIFDRKYREAMLQCLVALDLGVLILMLKEKYIIFFVVKG